MQPWCSDLVASFSCFDLTHSSWSKQEVPALVRTHQGIGTCPWQARLLAKRPSQSMSLAVPEALRLYLHEPQEGRTDLLEALANSRIEAAPDTHGHPTFGALCTSLCGSTCKGKGRRKRPDFVAEVCLATWHRGRGTSSEVLDARSLCQRQL